MQLIRSHITKTGLILLSLVSGTAHSELQVVGQERCGVGMGPGFWVAPPTTPQMPLIEGFVLNQKATSIEDTPAAQALAFISAGQWVKAIQAMEAVDRDDEQYVLDRHGVIRRASALKSTLISALPEEGRRIFRQLNNAAAQSHLAQSRATVSLDDRALAYAELIDRYPLCDPAGKAAIELGDLDFEQGRFEQAAAAYQFAIGHPANVGAEPELVARRLIALHRAGRVQATNELAQEARTRFSNTRVSLGGERVTIPELIERLPGKANQTQPAGAQTFTLSTSRTYAYAHSLYDPNLQRIVKLMASKHKLEHVIDTMLAPQHVVDQGRLFTVSIGGVTRVDPSTGRTLWSFGGALEFARTRTNQMHQLRQGYHQALAVDGNTVLAVLPDDANLGRSRLVALDTERGKLLWDSKKSAGPYATLAVFGQPLLDGDRVYACFRRDRDAKLLVVVLDRRTGKPIDSIELGTVINDARMNVPTELSPRLYLTEHHLIVLTNHGALAVFKRADHSLAWAYSHKIRRSGLSLSRQMGYVPPDSVAWHTGAVMVQNGLVISKDTRSNRIVAFREHDGGLVWSANTHPDATLVHVDHRHAYVLGEKLVALDLRTGEPVWWTGHAGKHAGKPAFTGDTCIVAGSERLCQFDLATGRLIAMNEKIQGHADTSVLDGKLIHLTDNSLRAFPLKTQTSEMTP